MKATTGFFQEKEGQNSATRLIFVLGSLWTMIMGSFFAIQGTEAPIVLMFMSGSQATFGGIKLGQKIMENKK